ncbi:MAG: FGGY family carbohydrate kinase [Clostridia bacterium]|nr:FGGY family carbohydrate kinase [Clostridia bacterium]
MNIIAIDCGASFIKGALIDDVREKIIKTEYRTVDIKPNVFNWDLQNSNIGKTLRAAAELICVLSEGLKEAKLCISNEMHGFVLTDEDGDLETDYVSWQNECALECEGGISYLQMLGEIVDEEDVMLSGMPLKAGLPSSGLFYLKSKGYLSKERYYFYTLGDYILRSISGVEPYIHPTNAAATGLFDIAGSCWNQRLIESISDGKVIFPEINDSKSINFTYGKTEFSALPAIGDQQAALLGAGVERRGILSFNMGTGAQVSVVENEAVFSRDFQTRPYFHGLYLNTIVHIPSGRALNVYFRFIKGILTGFCKRKIDDEEIWNYILSLTKKEETQRLDVDLSFFSNAVTQEKTGYIKNIQEDNFYVEVLIQSVFETMSKNFVSLSEKLISDKDSIDTIVFTGGLAKKIDYLRELIIDKFGREVNVRTEAEETFKGLMYYSKMRKDR